MTTEKKAARRSGNYDTRQTPTGKADKEIIDDYEKGTLVAGLMTALMFGGCLLHWAAM